MQKYVCVCVCCVRGMVHAIDEARVRANKLTYVYISYKNVYTLYNNVYVSEIGKLLALRYR